MVVLPSRSLVKARLLPSGDQAALPSLLRPPREGRDTNVTPLPSGFIDQIAVGPGWPPAKRGRSLVNAIRFPSGDQAGAESLSVLFVSRLAFDPSAAFIV